MGQVKQGTLIGAIYDAGSDPAHRGRALAALREAVGDETSLLFDRDSTVSMRCCEYIAMSGWTSEAIASYHEYYGSLDTRTPFVAQTPVGQVDVDDRQMPYREVTGSEIFRDFYRPLGLGHGMATTLFATGNRHRLVSVHRAIDNGPFPSEAVALFEWIAPHIVRSLQVQRQVQRSEDLAQGLALTLDHFPLAVLLITKVGTVRHMNGKAAEMLQEPGLPLQVAAGRLVTRCGRSADALREQLERAVGLACGESRATPALLKFRRCDGAPGSLSVMISPLRRGDQLKLAVEPLAAVFLSDPSQAQRLDRQVLMQQFGLTQAEASLATALVQGSNLADIAEVKHVLIETVRRQLKQAMAKTESRSQGQLIGRIARGLALLRRAATDP